MLQDFERVKSCRACGSEKLIQYLSLPDSPLANKLKSFRDLGIEEKKYEVKMLLCQNCFLSQLSIVVDPEVLFLDYSYHSSVSRSFADHCRQLAIDIKEEFTFKNNPPLSLDIASNDGCLMREFKAEGFLVGGIEPCLEMAKKCREEEKMEVLSEFFCKKNVDNVNPHDVITATNVFAHVDDLNDFLQAAKMCLEPEKGIFIVEVPHMLKLLDYSQFDTIYHEHLSYFLLRPLVQLFQKNGLEIFRAEEIEIHGGSLRVYASVSGTYKVENSVHNIIAKETAGKMYTVGIYFEFADWVRRLSADITTVMEFTEASGQKVIGYGASAKGISLINYLEIGKYFHSIVDETPYKQGKITPGSNLLIEPFEAFEREKPGYIVLLAWNFAEEMMEKTERFGAKFIIPIPEAEVV